MQSRRGVILVVVLVVVVLLTLAVFTFSKFMMAQRRGANTTLRQTQARLLTESGIEYLRVLLFMDQYTIIELGGLYDNPDEFCGHIITDGTIALSGYAAGMQTTSSIPDPYDVGRFSVIAPALSEDGLLTGDYIRYGLEDESTKINLRWVLAADLQQPGAGRMILMRLPGLNITEEIADAILDWIDDSSYEPREYGAKDEYYMMLDPPYYTRNGIPDSLDELLLVRGVTPKLLYGIDWNRNGIKDIGEPSEYSLDEYEVVDGSLNLGLISYLTLDSRESMLTPDGLYYKINVNMEDEAELRELLEERFEEDYPGWAAAIISYRQQLAQAGQNPTDANLGDILAAALTGGGGIGGLGNSDGKIKSLAEFIGVQGSPFSDDIYEIEEYMPVLYNNLTISDTPIVGRININQASRTVMELFTAQEDALTDAALFMGETVDTLTGSAFSQMNMWEIIDGILAYRISDPYQIAMEAPEMNYPFWVYTHGIITDLAVFKQLEPYFCTQGAVFKATVVGRFDEKSPVSRIEVWLDAAEGDRLPRIIRIRDISELGPGYSAELLGADQYAR